MPTYEYLCRDCDTKLEVVQSIHDQALTECPKCAGSLRKVYGNVGVVFKGSGFYRTDNRAKPSAPAGGADRAKGTTKPTPARETKSEPKAASTPSTDSSKVSTAAAS